jgi:hypothetical protein
MKKQKTEQNEEVLFTTDSGEDITFSDVLKAVYQNSRQRAKTIVDVSNTASRFITDVSSAVLMLPNLTGLNNSAIKNDDSLLTLATIVERRNRAIVQTTEGDTGIISESDRKRLLEQAKQIASRPSAANSKSDG